MNIFALYMYFLHLLVEALFWTLDIGLLIESVLNNFVHLVGLLLRTVRMRFRTRATASAEVSVAQ